MVEFGTGYVNAMDREHASNHHDHGHDHGHSTGDVNISAGELGSSFGLGPVPNINAILSKLRAGSKTVELAFMGMGKGAGGGHTAGMYGKKQRQALREAAEANRLDFTTHTSVGVFGLAGQDRQGNFSRDSKIQSLQEIKRAIEFASDVGRGGPVVVHTGEFNRAFTETDWNTTGKYAGKFESFPGEDERAKFYVVDRRTGETKAVIDKGRSVTKPLWKTYEEGDNFWDKKGGDEYRDRNGEMVKKGDFIDEWGNKVDKEKRVPIFDPETGGFKTQQLDWNDLKKEAIGMTKEAREFWEKNKDSSSEVWNNSKWGRFKDIKRIEDVRVFPEEAYMISNIETNMANSQSYAMQYTRDFEENVKDVERLEKAYDIHKKIEEETDPEERWQLEKQISDLGDLVPPETKMGSEVLKKMIDRKKYAINQAQTTAAGQWSQVKEQENQLKHLESARRYALEESYDSYARAGVYAADRSNQLREQGKLKKEIRVAMENLFPEAYGAHPDELMKIVRGSREKMQNMLVESRGLSEKKAKEVAQHTLTVTFDTGHMNMWRKYWKNDDSKSLKQNEKDFDDWAVDMVDQMSKEKMIGHVHLDDNYGYQDEHLAPGEGNTPIKRMVNTLKKNGYKGELIVEPGADFTNDSGGFQSVMKTWKLFGSPIYGAGSNMGTGNWNSIGGGYFGVNRPANFTVGAYSPSEDWSLWSGVPFE